MFKIHFSLSRIICQGVLEFIRNTLRVCQACKNKSYLPLNTESQIYRVVAREYFSINI